MALDLGALARGAGHAARDGGHELLGVARRKLLGAADAAQAVNAGRVAVNGAVCVKPDRQLAPQDVLALRGKGKLRLLSLGGETKKGRQALTVGIYE